MKNVVVIKIGSNSLIDTNGLLDKPYLSSIASQITSVMRDGWTPVLVSSGAVAAGMAAQGMTTKPSDLHQRQALAAIGQIGLVAHWEEAFRPHNTRVAQLLLSHGDFSDRERNQNFTATLRALCEWNVIPIINENDPVATHELSVGDNDQLSALVATQLGADVLVLLTDVPGVYSADPRSNPDAKLLSHIPVVTSAIIESAGTAGARGRGGMRSKVEAARLAAACGVRTVIAHARVEDVLLKITQGDECVGTNVSANGSQVTARQRWLAVARRVRGKVVVSEKACEQITSGFGLQYKDIVSVEGRFGVGDTVSIYNELNDEIARGLAALNSAEMKETVSLLKDDGFKGTALVPEAAIHRDDVMLLCYV